MYIATYGQEPGFSAIRAAGCHHHVRMGNRMSPLGDLLIAWLKAT